VLGLCISTGFWLWVLRDQYIAVRSRLSTAESMSLHSASTVEVRVDPGGKDTPRGIVSAMVAREEASVPWESPPIVSVY
jgi:hypothetical protein